MILCNMMTNILSVLFLFIILMDKTCHTLSMKLVANTCLAQLLCASTRLADGVFALKNDLEQIRFEDKLCTIRGYLICVAYAAMNYSFLLQAIYRYMIIVYPTRLFWHSRKFQLLLMCSMWIFCLGYCLAFIFIEELPYNVDNQICLVPLRLSFALVYTAFLVYVIPVCAIMFVYFQLVRYVYQMSRRVIPTNTLSRARRELKMVRRTVILLLILLTLGIPYAAFDIVSFFTSPPRYHFRIALVFVDVSLTLIMIVFVQFTDPIKAAIRKRIDPRRNTVRTIGT
jgi:hypothetical protein